MTAMSADRTFVLHVRHLIPAMAFRARREMRRSCRCPRSRTLSWPGFAWLARSTPGSSSLGEGPLHDDHVGKYREQRTGARSLYRVLGHFRVERMVDRHRGHVRGHDGVAVGRRLATRRCRVAPPAPGRLSTDHGGPISPRASSRRGGQRKSCCRRRNRHDNADRLSETSHGFGSGGDIRTARPRRRKARPRLAERIGLEFLRKRSICVI